MSRKRCKYKGSVKSLIITLLIIAAGFMVNLGGRLLEGSAYPRAYTEAVEQYAEEYGLTRKAECEPMQFHPWAQSGLCR